MCKTNRRKKRFNFLKLKTNFSSLYYGRSTWIIHRLSNIEFVLILRFFNAPLLNQTRIKTIHIHKNRITHEWLINKRKYEKEKIQYIVVNAQKRYYRSESIVVVDDYHCVRGLCMGRVYIYIRIIQVICKVYYCHKYNMDVNKKSFSRIVSTKLYIYVLTTAQLCIVFRHPHSYVIPIYVFMVYSFVYGFVFVVYAHVSVSFFPRYFFYHITMKLMKILSRHTVCVAGHDFSSYFSFFRHLQLMNSECFFVDPLFAFTLTLLSK